MKILFLGDIVGDAGFNSVKQNLPNIISSRQIDFVCVNGENAASNGVGLTENIANELFNAGVDVITTGNHVWDQKEIYEFIKTENKLLRPLNMNGNLPGNGFSIYNSKKNLKVGVLNLMGNVFMKKCNDVFKVAEEFIEKNKIKKDFNFLVVDFHAEITSEKMAIGNLFDGFATLVIGTHTHVPTNDARVLRNGTGYLTDAGMCGDYNSIIGMDTQNSLNKFLKKDSIKHFPATGDATLSGVIVECNVNDGLAKNVESFIFGGSLKNNI
tara:strand:+ start:344 stop:1150 length:807 start_codon:yes stop_codon:yes gene_type:complete